MLVVGLECSSGEVVDLRLPNLLVTALMAFVRYGEGPLATSGLTGSLREALLDRPACALCLPLNKRLLVLDSAGLTNAEALFFVNFAREDLSSMSLDEK